jgi:transposase
VTRSRTCSPRNLETFTADQFAKVIDTADADAHGRQVAAAWIAKEKLRHALNLRARASPDRFHARQVRDRLLAFYIWCAQNDDIPELVSLAQTVSRREDDSVYAVLAGVANVGRQSLNRFARATLRNQSQAQTATRTQTCTLTS